MKAKDVVKESTRIGRSGRSVRDGVERRLAKRRHERLTGYSLSVLDDKGSRFNTGHKVQSEFRKSPFCIGFNRARAKFNVYAWIHFGHLTLHSVGRYE